MNCVIIIFRLRDILRYEDTEAIVIVYCRRLDCVETSKKGSQIKLILNFLLFNQTGYIELYLA